MVFIELYFLLLLENRKIDFNTHGQASRDIRDENLEI